VAYVKTTWVDEVTPTSAANFNHMEQGIYDAVRGQAEDALRVVRGHIGAAGGVAAGVGFTITKNGTGDYTITFTTPFSAEPTVAPAVQGGAGQVASVNNGRAVNSGAVSVLTASGGVATDLNWHFIAVGPA
jgi:hypothetical protein